MGRCQQRRAYEWEGGVEANACLCIQKWAAKYSRAQRRSRFDQESRLRYTRQATLLRKAHAQPVVPSWSDAVWKSCFSISRRSSDESGGVSSLKKPLPTFTDWPPGERLKQGAWVHVALLGQLVN